MMLSEFPAEPISRLESESHSMRYQIYSTSVNYIKFSILFFYARKGNWQIILTTLLHPMLRLEKF